LSNTVKNIEANKVKDEATNSILTVANLISFIRLCLIPSYLFFLFSGNDYLACFFFALAAITDFLDGQVARRTHTVSKLGQVLDPAIDTLLMITGIVGVFAIGRLPLWIMIFVFVRELFLLIGGAILLKRFNIRVPVIYPGKFATTFLFIGIAGLLLGAPQIAGLGLCDISWLPGFNYGPCGWAIWFVYAGVALQLGVTVYYCITAYKMLIVKLKGSSNYDA
jgi:cardiolipin synthase